MTTRKKTGARGNLPLIPGLEPVSTTPKPTGARPTKVSRKEHGPALMQLKITLRHIKPQIWRRVLVRDSYTLRDLHHIIQTVMGWDNEHMYAFREKRDELPERSLLSQLMTRKGATILYEYDFGDGWEHEIKLEKIEPFGPARSEPVCLAGARACPPEDCGGAYGYSDILEALRNPSDPEKVELLEWVGEEYDPEAFHIDAVNLFLRKGRKWGG